MLVLEARVHYVNSYCHICSKGCVGNKAQLCSTRIVTDVAKVILEITVHYSQQMSHI